MAVAAAALSLGGCQRGGGGNAEPMNFKKLTNGKAVYRGEEAGLRHYAVTLWTNGHSTAAVDNYKDADISLALELVTAASGAANRFRRVPLFGRCSGRRYPCFGAEYVERFHRVQLRRRPTGTLRRQRDGVVLQREV